MSKSTVERENALYNELYGDIPNTQAGRLAYILGKRANNQKLANDIKRTAGKIKRIKSNKIEFTLWKVLKPAARPRANTTRGYIKMYVPRAAANGDWFADYIKDLDLPVIDTPCKLFMDHYEKTPSSFSVKQKVLAELGLIKPTRRTGDFDNFLKSLADMSMHGLLKDDCLIYESRVRLFYSIKPHVDVCFEYMAKNPFDLV